MKKIDITKMIIDNDLYYTERKEILGMEFIKMGDKYLIKNSNGIIVDEKEKKQLEAKELIIEDIKADCAKHITPKLTKKKKEIEELENIEETKPIKD